MISACVGLMQTLPNSPRPVRWFFSRKCSDLSLHTFGGGDFARHRWVDGAPFYMLTPYYPFLVRFSYFSGLTTVQFSAPEIIRGKPYGHAVDWWALGVLACRMFTGQYPFDNLSRYLLTHPGDGTAQESVTTSAGAVQSERPEPSWTLPEAVDRLPPAERDLLQRLLQPVPEKRLRSLLQLQRIAIYQHYRWDDVRNFKMKPQSYIQHSTLDYETTQEMFSDFL